MQPTTVKPRVDRRYLLLALLLALAVYVLVPQIGDFRSSWHLLGHATPGWTTVAVCLTLLTYPAAAMTYYLLSLKPLKYALTVLVQLAAMFVNRLLPGGIGALGANYTYLRAQRLSRVQAASLVAVNNLLGMAGHGLLLVILLIADPLDFLPKYHRWNGRLSTVIVVVALVVILAVLILGRTRFQRQIKDLADQLRGYKQRLWRLPLALLSSTLLTIFNVTCLIACGLALGVHLPLAATFLVFTFGVGAGTATPTPGGLGGYEAALAAGFIAYHVASPVALATALLYRLVSYWLPLGFGALAFVSAQRRHVFSSSD